MIEITLADHEAGFKEVEVTDRTGNKQIIRLTAPPLKRLATLNAECFQEGNNWPVLRACLPVETAPAWLDRLTMDSAGEMMLVAYLLAKGWEHQKKMEAGAKDHAEKMMALISPAPKSDSAPAASPPPSGTPGASPSGGSAST